MITEYAQILEVGTDKIKVSIRSSSGCGACSAKSGCGNGILDRWLNPTRIMWIDSEIEYCAVANVGDEIQVGVDENAFVRNAFYLYMVPILVFLLGAAIGYQIQGEVSSILGGILGLLAGAFAVRYLVKRSPYAADFSPRVLKQTNAEIEQYLTSQGV